MARGSLPPGFRFHPTDVELVMYYLKRKLKGKKLHFEAILELNIYKFSPWDLPDKSCLRSKDLEWYFFCPRERKYASGARTNRATENGFWKTTGKDRHVVYNEKTVGMVKTLIFHTGHAPQGERTNWVMHEYRIEDKDLADAGVQDTYVLCKVFQKSGLGPRNGAQYGAPFNEEEWDDDAEIRDESSPVDALPLVGLVLPNNQNDSVVTSMFIPGGACSQSISEPGPSTARPYANELSPYLPADDIDALLAMFREDGPSLLVEDDNNNAFNNLNQDKNIEAVTCSDGNDIYDGLGDLGNWEDLGEGGFNNSSFEEAGYAVDPMVLGGDIAFLELNDLNTPLKFPAESSAEPSASERDPTDGSCAPYNCCDNLEQLCCGANFSGGVHNASCVNQSHMLPEGSYRRVDDFDVSQKENGIGDSANLVYNAPSFNVAFTPCGPEGSRDAAEAQIRGEQQRIPCSRLQQLLESIPARPASAAESLTPMNRAEKSNRSFSLYGGSSIHVKAQVNPRVCGCAKDALSVKLGESTCASSCVCNLPMADLRKEVASRGSGFAFIFYLGMITALIWVFIVALSIKLGRYAWNFIVS